MKQKLMHLYFNTVLERLQTHQFSPSRLLTMIAETEQVTPLLALNLCGFS